MAKKENPDWFIYLDADERFDEDFKREYPKLLEQKDYDAICLELYDFYLTPEDYDLPYNGDIVSMRNYCGPEYRNTLIMFRNIPKIYYPCGVVGEPRPFIKSRVLYSKYKVKHYGKAISVEEWERKVDFYIKRYTGHKDKWQQRKGKAVHHDTSDFGAKLITWGQLKANPSLRGELLYEYNPGVPTLSKYSVWLVLVMLRQIWRKIWKGFK
ncbi:MAG: hypothetical protein DRP97_00750 [Candidatus Latescibacterota bacterium]|nr:MAG: hypothetical protein DRP97_00750 [Candidatus Latescibacterota bacterium]